MLSRDHLHDNVHANRHLLSTCVIDYSQAVHRILPKIYKTFLNNLWTFFCIVLEHVFLSEYPFIASCFVSFSLFHFLFYHNNIISLIVPILFTAMSTSRRSRGTRKAKNALSVSASRSTRSVSGSFSASDFITSTTVADYERDARAAICAAAEGVYNNKLRLLYNVEVMGTKDKKDKIDKKKLKGQNGRKGPANL